MYLNEIKRFFKGDIMKKIQIFIVTLMITCFTLPVFAIDQAAKEEITPPAAEGLLTVDQIPPFNSIPLANNNPPQATQSAPATPASSEPLSTDQTPVAMPQ